MRIAFKTKVYRCIYKFQNRLKLSRGTRCKCRLIVLLALVSVIMMLQLSSQTRSTKIFLHLRNLHTRHLRLSQGDEKRERIDWNNYTLMHIESLRTGPGEQGLPVTFRLSPEEKNVSDILYQRHKLNAFVSNLISLDRSIGDHRYESCKKRLFLKDIPNNSVSVVIPFHNEHMSTVLRTVHSVLNRSPSSLLREIILADDASTWEYLLQPLEGYIKQHFKKVRLIRNEEHLGLMQTRVAGADVSKGSFLLFLDAHIEVNYNYLPPLLEPIVLDYKTITVPMTDGIDGTLNFKYTEFGPDRGGFDWTMFYQRLPLLKKDQLDITQNREVPTMLGCAFAISRRWWEEIGKFDPGLKVWGGEQYEISFKTWQCGGRMLDVPCSRIGHIFRKQLPYEVISDELNMNFLRVASVWMDEYKESIFQRIPKLRKKEPGDLKDQVEIRRRLNCKPFKWFMTHIAPDIIYYFPLTNPPRLAYGILQSMVDLSLCLMIKHTMDGDFYSSWLGPCVKENNTFVEYSWKNQIRTFIGAKCLVPVFGKLMASACSINGTRQKFAWDPKTGWLVNLDNGLCLNANLQSYEVDMQSCGMHPAMSWAFFDGFVNGTLVDKYWNRSKQHLIDSRKWLAQKY